MPRCHNVDLPPHPEGPDPDSQGPKDPSGRFGIQGGQGSPKRRSTPGEPPQEQGPVGDTLIPGDDHGAMNDHGTNIGLRTQD